MSYFKTRIPIPCGEAGSQIIAWCMAFGLDSCGSDRMISVETQDELDTAVPTDFQTALAKNLVLPSWYDRSRMFGEARRFRSKRDARTQSSPPERTKSPANLSGSGA